jgi:putative flippase GtrA
MNKLYTLMNLRRPLFFQLVRFGIVGLTGAALHFSIVVGLVQQLKMAPLVANVFAFLFAFQVSYWGHRCWTFRWTTASHRAALPKLLCVQLVNLAVNETLFFIFLSLHYPYPVALIIVLTILPIFTFIFSKWWVFKA